MIQASLLNSYCFCPRSVYLSRVLKLEPAFSESRAAGLLGHAVRRELSLRQPRILSKAGSASEIESLLSSELECILADVPFIYRELLSGLDCEAHVASLRSELSAEIRILRVRLCSLVDDVGVGEAVRVVSPWSVEYPVRSERLGLSGRIDKVLKEKGFSPVEIKTSSVPPSGVWEGDRIQTCAYSLLLEDSLSLEEPVLFGFVEYSRVHEMRPVFASDSLRRRVLEVRDLVEGVLGGSVPKPHENKNKCGGCGYKGVCSDI